MKHVCCLRRGTEPGRYGPRAYALCLVVIGFLVTGGEASARQFHLARADRPGVAGWSYRGITIVPNNPTDLASTSFHATVLRAQRDGANAIAITIQYLQSSRTSDDIHASPTTPTSAALSAAVTYVHSRHMKVSLKVLFDVTPPRAPAMPLWRWNINPTNRAVWFKRATALEVGLAQERPDLIVVGTEMGTLTSVHPATARWITLIAAIRKVYTGLLTYEAQTPAPGIFGAEAMDVGFWHYLDFVTLSGYNSLSISCNAPLSQLEQSWSEVADAYYRPLEHTLGLPIVFGEIGYSSIRCDEEHPWEYFRADPRAPVDLREQAKLYTAFFDFWRQQTYVGGAFIWNWSIGSHVGGPANRDFTPQDKPAEGDLKAAFTSHATGPPAGTELSY